MEDLDREQSSLTGNEKKIIIRVYQYFLNTRQCRTQRPTYYYARRLLRFFGIATARVVLNKIRLTEEFSECSERKM